ncbi:hypothetical protein [Mangrovivirga cuniculi]|uniref:Lipocalin-like domain-containing protein n=1 Tax=Mangrovivirga cuniculi TaxID=2715131 RepID=A0A4D7JXC9_9BACT|nr:hypothetical protein [Mangrovivirga cuniculi]QCK16806.1 hypothetical protein DCC35_19740 [Mangrovivirga cuniculi]
MKRFYLAIFISFALLSGCKDDEPGKEEVQVNNLSKTWSLGADGYVMVNSQDISYDYSEFSIRFSDAGGDKVYYVTNGHYAFPAAIDTWNFTDQNFEEVVRHVDGTVMETNVENNTLTIRFNIPQPSNGKLQGGFGDFEFYLTEYK